ncbi:MAG TPA: hypothetical protein V6C95_00670 [Coleofasciculaceae cyanobacterium]
MSSKNTEALNTAGERELVDTEVETQQQSSLQFLRVKICISLVKRRLLFAQSRLSFTFVF